MRFLAALSCIMIDNSSTLFVDGVIMGTTILFIAM